MRALDGHRHVAPHGVLANHPRIRIARLAVCERRNSIFDPSKIVWFAITTSAPAAAAIWRKRSADLIYVLNQ